jgi:putative selenium metabolism protein SsnA
MSKILHHQILITNGTLIPMTEPLGMVRQGAVLIEDGQIIDIGTANEVAERVPGRRKPNTAVQTINANGKLILPGAITAHTHVYGAFARGLAIPGKPAANFAEVLQKLWWRLDRALDIEAVKYSALVCAIDAIKHGTTTLIDHHASPDAIPGSLDAIAESLNLAGLRGALAYEITDRNGPKGTAAGLAENVRFAKKVAENPSGPIKAAVGVHASFTVGKKTLEQAVAAARDLNVPLHIHAAEDKADQDDALKTHKLRVIERLAAAGALTDKTMLAHCVHVNAKEIKAIAKAGAKVMHQPRSNMNNGVGVAPINEMLEAGITVGLGNDGFSNNAFTEMKTADLLQKVHAHDPRALGADKVVRMSYTHNAAIAGMFWPHPVGTLQIGAAADVVLMDYPAFTDLNADNLPWHMLFGMDGAQVTHTIANGKILMMDRKLLTITNEAEIYAKAREASARVWKKFATLSK